jgi:hypothetical protein
MEAPKRKVHNILEVYHNAPVDLKESGALWYAQAHHWCEVRAQLYGLSVETVAAVVSALSPRNKWERNLKDADQVLYAAANQKTPAWPKCATFSQNVVKAYFIAVDQAPERALTSPKTRAFVKCIVDPHHESAVVVDVWAKRVADGNPNAPAVGLNEHMYKLYADAYRQAAKKVGALPLEVQAATWVMFRYQVGNGVPAGQMTLL